LRRVSRERQRFVLIAAIVAAGFCTLPVNATGADDRAFRALETEFNDEIRPRLQRFCFECHSTDVGEGDIDLEQFATLSEVRRQIQTWQKVAEVLGSGEMPPPKAAVLLPAADRHHLREWLRRYLSAEGQANAGDPGPVVLRRLSNAEYTYTIRDLTGVRSLDPAREFPADGAAGEGFTNTGDALVMSPALLTKYLDAGKEIARHMVLSPDGIRFSSGTTRRDWTDEIVARIRAIYLRHTTGNRDVSILDRWSVADPKKATANDGRVALERYLAALIRHRDRVLGNPGAAVAIAATEELNGKYMVRLAEMLVAPKRPTAILDAIRRRWQTASVADAPSIVADIRAWQDQLWKFNAVGHFGDVRPWQEPVDPLPDSVSLRRPLESTRDGVVLYLVATDAGDGREGDRVIWRRPRIEFKNRPPILLRDVPKIVEQVERAMSRELGRTEVYLAAVMTLKSSGRTIEETATQRNLDAGLLTCWTEYLGIGPRAKPTITGRLTTKLTKVHGYAAINGWGSESTPSLLTNRSDRPISFLTLTVPARGVTVHPSPNQQAVVRWKSPIVGRVAVRGKVADADDKCGNGTSWSLELASRNGTSLLAAGVADNGRGAQFRPDSVFEVRPGDVVSLAVDARHADHSCDTTHVELTITEIDGRRRIWDLAGDVADDILSGNPHADSHGNPDVWHFCAVKHSSAPSAVVPPGSSLAKWRAAVLADEPTAELERCAREVQTALGTPNAPLAEPDKSLVHQLRDCHGPLRWVARSTAGSDEPNLDSAPERNTMGIDGVLFGVAPRGKTIDSASLTVEAPCALPVRLPAALVSGGEFVVDGSIDAAAGDGSVQLALLPERPGRLDALIAGVPVVTPSAGNARQRLQAAHGDFRRLFPAAMCYPRIVPVDEVVTLVQFHREDSHLCELMLNDMEKAELDRLWRELRFVSQDALTSVDAYAQLMEYATQDSDPKLFEPLRKPIHDRAEAFRRLLVDAQPRQLAALLEFASQAYRRPLSAEEQRELRGLYHALREQKIEHAEALRLAFARVLVAPSFLYRLETSPPGAAPQPVSDWELASRLSYFLWSSAPDAELRQSAASGRLHEPTELINQTRRMLRDERVRRLSVEFACQWLQIRDFDTLDEKSEQHFPDFARLRGDMYEEAIRFFIDLFQNDGSVLDILDADHTFLTEPLARHYGIPGINGAGWQRVDGIKQFNRGGILGLAATLAKHSGASRTSPVLRGNWVTEVLLGEKLPRPPKDVPQLPDDEAASDNLTVRQRVERHSADPRCSKCHVRIDPYGFALEGFDAIGRRREKDLGGRPIDTHAQLMDGSTFEGIDGLRRHLLTARRDAVVSQFCRKLLGYALGRTVRLSDEPLLQDMMTELARRDYRLAAAVERIVLSKQFRMIRGAEKP
jgi:hypothetical protein